MKAREIMTKDPEVLTPSDTVVRAAKLMGELDVGIIPIVEDTSSRKLRGVITDRDIAVRHVAEGHGEECPISSDMSEATVTAGPDDDVKDVMRRMQREQVRRVPIVEDGRRLVGIVAQADLAIDAKDEREVEKTVEEISRPAKPKR